MIQDDIVWVYRDRTDRRLFSNVKLLGEDDCPLLAGRHGEGGYPIAMLIDFCESGGQQVRFEQFREVWGRKKVENT